MTDSNWEAIIKEAEPYIDRWFTDECKNYYKLFGVVHGSDDYYYGIWDDECRQIMLLSCVIDLTGYFNTYGYKWEEE